jgi:outer membrane receptor protein involved in Fe transport
VSEPDGVARTDLVELMAAQRVEVVPGPVSALYGGSSGHGDGGIGRGQVRAD